ncbi:MAG: phosphate acetyltransferase [Sphingobacteriales bacterium]|nr:phosphate acetyltransferase [Sphingobacteriales bacterium]
MSNAIYIVTTESYSGKSVIALGLMNMLLSKARKIGYFKPVINTDPIKEKDIHIETIHKYFGLTDNYPDAYAFTRNEVMKHSNDDRRSEIIDTIISKFKKLEEKNDFTVVEGSDFLGEGIAFEFDANVQFARNLGIPVLIVINGENKLIAEIINNSVSAVNSFRERGIEVIAVFANKVKETDVADLRLLLPAQLPDSILSVVIPGDKSLFNPTMKEIADAIKGEILFGENQLSNPVNKFIVGAMQLHNSLNHLQENTLIVTPGDRGDLIIGALQANISKNYPNIAGLVLTGNVRPEKSIMRLIDGLESVVPIIAVKKGTFETTNKIGSIRSRIYPENTEKIELAIATFEKHVDINALLERMIKFQSSGVTPRMFQYQLVKRAREHKKHIVLPEGNDERILTAAAKLISQKIVDLTILGNKDDIKLTVQRLGLKLDLNKINIINPSESELYDDYVETLHELRKNKSVNMEMARDLMTDVSYFGTMMVYKGHADGMVSGAIHTTQHTIRPALQFVKTKKGVSTVSSIFFMCLADRVSVFGDCAVNPNPTAEQLAEIAISSAESSLSFGIEPKIAMLSYSSGTSGEGEDVDKVRLATEIVRQLRPDLKIEGPIQYDAAVDPVIGRQKLPNSDVAGQASVLIFPDLNTGNNTYKAVQRETGALAIGPMLQGLNKPVNDLSRGCTVDDIFNTVIITAIQAQM